MAVMFVAGMFLGMPSEDRGNYAMYATALVMFGAIGTIISQWYNKGVTEAWDTVTSIIKFVDEGHTELVGQVRPANFLPMDIVHVDGYRDPDWTFDNLAVWSWNYRVYKCKEERYYDEQSKSWKTRTVCNWHHVRGASDQRDFMLHDGSGGIIVDLKSFQNTDIGQPIWSRTEPGKMGGDGLYLAGDIRKHEWTLWALQLGDPVYLMARIRSRPFDEIPKGMVANNSSRVHHTLMAVGEDAVRRRAMGESDRASRSVADHMEIIEALESRDAELATRLVREHTMRLHDHIEERWTRLNNLDKTKQRAVKAAAEKIKIKEK